MFASDLFRKLSCGAKFTSKNKLPIKRKLETADTTIVPKLKVCIKKESDRTKRKVAKVTKTPVVTLADVQIKSEDSESEQSSGDEGQQKTALKKKNKAPEDAELSKQKDLMVRETPAAAFADVQIKSEDSESEQSSGDDEQQPPPQKKKTKASEEAELSKQKAAMATQVPVDADFADVQIKSEIFSSEEISDDEEQQTSSLKKKTDKAALVDMLRRNRLRNKLKISVKQIPGGPKVPTIIDSFEQLSIEYGVSNRLVSNVLASYRAPTPVQMQAIPILMKTHSLHACAPTGSGKTAAFLIPILHHLAKPMRCGFRALIICPTRELAKQTQREALRLGDEMNLRTHVIQTVDDPKKSDYSFSSGRSYDILVTTPNRICYLLSQNPPKIDLSNIQWVVIDEADKLFEDSKNSFRDQLDTVLSACNNPSKTIALFSATETQEVNAWVAKNVPNRIRFSVGLINGAVELVEQKLLFTGNEAGKLFAFREMVAQGLHPPVLVFVQSKDRAQQLFTELIYDGLNVDVIHSDRTQRERDNVVRAFREGKIWILICTELMSRGIDFKGVNLVVNYDFPPSSISYVHRIGRTGRAGRPGKAVTFFTKDDTVNLKSIAQLIKTAGGEVPDYMLQLHATSKKEREKVMKKAPKRATIRTIPAFELQQLQRKKRFVNKSKGKTKFSMSSRNSSNNHDNAGQPKRTKLSARKK